MWGDKAKTDGGRERNLKYKTAKRRRSLKKKGDENGKKITEQRQKGVIRCRNKSTTEERERERGLKYKTTRRVNAV